VELGQTILVDSGLYLVLGYWARRSAAPGTIDGLIYLRPEITPYAHLMVQRRSSYSTDLGAWWRAGWAPGPWRRQQNHLARDLTRRCNRQPPQGWLRACRLIAQELRAAIDYIHSNPVCRKRFHESVSSRGGDHYRHTGKSGDRPTAAVSGVLIRKSAKLF